MNKALFQPILSKFLTFHILTATCRIVAQKINNMPKTTHPPSGLADHGEQGDHGPLATEAIETGTPDDADERCSTRTTTTTDNATAQHVNNVARGPKLWIPRTDHNDRHVATHPIVDQTGQDLDIPATGLERDAALSSTLDVDTTNASCLDHERGSVEKLLGEALASFAVAIDDLMMDTRSEGNRDDVSMDEETADRKILPVISNIEQTLHANPPTAAISRRSGDISSTATPDNNYLSSAIFTDWPQPEPIWSGRSSDAGITVQTNNRTTAVQTERRGELAKRSIGTLVAGSTSKPVKAQHHFRHDGAAQDQTNSNTDAELGTETYSTENDDVTGMANGSSSSPDRPPRRGCFAFLMKLRSPPVQKIAPSRPARVEPKSFFANERTFIQWISIALLLATIDSLTPTSDISSVAKLRMCLMSCAGILIVYSVSVYYWRLSLLSNSTPYGYTDRVGPVILVVAVLLGGSIMFVTKYGGKSSGPALTVLQEDRDCYRYYHGLSPLEYEPSDVAVQNNLMLIPSHSDVTAISTAWSTTARTVITVPGTDIEAICVVDDRLFVVSEGSKESILIELAWTTTKMAWKWSAIGHWIYRKWRVWRTFQVTTVSSFMATIWATFTLPRSQPGEAPGVFWIFGA
jgi:hypothetical protein